MKPLENKLDPALRVVIERLAVALPEDHVKLARHIDAAITGYNRNKAIWNGSERRGQDDRRER